MSRTGSFQGTTKPQACHRATTAASSAVSNGRMSRVAMYQSPESIAEMLHAISATGEGTAAVLRCQTGRWVIHGILQARPPILYADLSDPPLKIQGNRKVTQRTSTPRNARLRNSVPNVGERNQYWVHDLTSTGAEFRHPIKRRKSRTASFAPVTTLLRCRAYRPRHAGNV